MHVAPNRKCVSWFTLGRLIFLFLTLQVVADRVLLARLVLLREELRLRAEQQVARTQFFGNIGHDAFTANEQINPSNSQDNSGSGASNKFFAFHRSNLPARCAAFMKELLGVPERDRRLGIITKVRQLVVALCRYFAFMEGSKQTGPHVKCACMIYILSQLATCALAQIASANYCCYAYGRWVAR